MSKAAALYKRMINNTFIPANDLHDNPGFLLSTPHYIGFSFFVLYECLTYSVLSRTLRTLLKREPVFIVKYGYIEIEGQGRADHIFHFNVERHVSLTQENVFS